MAGEWHGNGMLCVNRPLMCCFNILRRLFYRFPELGSFIALKALYPLGQPVAALVLMETGEGIGGWGGRLLICKVVARSV